MSLILSVLEQGMIYAIMALGIYITYKILDFPDLTVDGSFPMGAALTCVLIAKGVNPLLTLPVSFLAGVAVGVLTGIIHVKLKEKSTPGAIQIPELLSPKGVLPEQPPFHPNPRLNPDNTGTAFRPFPP